MAPAVFHHAHRVSYADCTVGNHVYYSRLLDILEAARGDFVRQLGHSFGGLQEQGFIFPVVQAELRYARPARYDEDLTVELQVKWAERVRLDFVYHVVGPDKRLRVKARSEHVCTGLTDRPQRLPVGLLSALEPYRLGPKPDRK